MPTVPDSIQSHFTRTTTYCTHGSFNVGVVMLTFYRIRKLRLLRKPHLLGKACVILKAGNLFLLLPKCHADGKIQ